MKSSLDYLMCNAPEPTGPTDGIERLSIYEDEIGNSTNIEDLASQSAASRSARAELVLPR